MSEGIKAARRAAESALDLAGVVGASVRQHLLQEVVNKVLLRRGSDAVLLLGASGAGKEKTAEAIHGSAKTYLGRSGDYFVLNCATLQGQMLASELYGHRKGAFTGADAAHIGIVERANGGTLVLDEVHCLSSEDQAQLLRLLGEREYRPLGRHEARHADVLFVLSSNQDLEAAVRSGTFRRDLLDRAQAVIRLPELWERAEDIPDLVHAFVEEVATQCKLPVLPVDQGSLWRTVEALRASRTASVRQLRQRVRDAYFLALAEEAPSIVLHRELPSPPGDARPVDFSSFSLPESGALWRPAGVDARAHALACQAVRHLVGSRKVESYSALLDAIRLLMRSALWSISGASSQAEFRAYVARLTGAEPSKASVHQLFSELTSRELPAGSKKGTTVTLDSEEDELLGRVGDRLLQLTQQPLTVSDAARRFGDDELLQLLLRQFVYVAEGHVHSTADTYLSRRGQEQPLAAWLKQQEIQSILLGSRAELVARHRVVCPPDARAWLQQVRGELITAIERACEARHAVSTATVVLLGCPTTAGTPVQGASHPQALLTLLDRAAALRADGSNDAFITKMSLHDRLPPIGVLFSILDEIWRRQGPVEPQDGRLLEMTLVVHAE